MLSPDAARAPQPSRGLGTARRPLTVVDGNYDIRRWPIAVPPLPDENNRSWQIRAGHRYGLPPKQLAQVAVENFSDLETRCPSPVMLRPGLALEAILGLEHGAALDARTAVHTMRGLPRATWDARYCPRCLAESPYWRAYWSYALVCHEHAAHLLDACPRCHNHPFPERTWPTVDLPANRCHNRLNSSSDKRRVRTPCATDLATAPVIQVPRAWLQAASAWEEVNTQSALEDVDLGGLTCKARQAAHAFGTLLWLAGGDETIGTANQDFGEALITTHRAYVELSTKANWGATPGKLLTPQGPATVLAAAALKAHAPRTFDCALQFRTGRTWPSFPAHWTDNPRDRLPEHGIPAVPAHWIPQVAWPETIPPVLNGEDPHDRALFSLVLLKLGRTNRWADLAFELDLPSTAQGRLTHRIQHLSAQDKHIISKHAEDLVAALTRQPHPIDYRERRVRFAWTGHHANDAHFVAFGQNMHIDLTEARQALPRFWELASGNDITFAPRALRIAAGTAEYRAYRTACPHLDSRLYSAFEHHIQCHPDYWQRSYVREPLSWAPI